MVISTVLGNHLEQTGDALIVLYCVRNVLYSKFLLMFDQNITAEQQVIRYFGFHQRGSLALPTRPRGLGPTLNFKYRFKYYQHEVSNQITNTANFKISSSNIATLNFQIQIQIQLYLNPSLVSSVVNSDIKFVSKLAMCECILLFTSVFTFLTSYF